MVILLLRRRPSPVMLVVHETGPHHRPASPRSPAPPPSAPTAQINFVLLISRQGKTRLTKWYKEPSQKEKTRCVREVTAAVLSRPAKQCNFIDWRANKIVYKRYVRPPPACQHALWWANAGACVWSCSFAATTRERACAREARGWYCTGWRLEGVGEKDLWGESGGEHPWLWEAPGGRRLPLLRAAQRYCPRAFAEPHSAGAPHP